MVNERFVDPHDTVQESDTIKIRQHGLYRAYKVLEAQDINLSKQEAKRFYEEVTAPDALEKFRQVELANREWRGASKREGSPRPSKKDRRDLDKWRGNK